jgi:alkylated DNA repair protein (DNA oxidative demethylase)
MSLVELTPGAYILRGFALSFEAEWPEALQTPLSTSPFRQMQTPGGHKMSVAMTSCGPLGWITDRSGYRYSPIDPTTNKSWPSMPDCFLQLAQQAAQTAGFQSFNPNSCLINRYETGAKMSLHQDKDEGGFDAPIVSVSLGIPAVFIFGGAKRSDKTSRSLLTHDDVVVWGGPARLNFHGIQPVKASYHPFAGSERINLTFRQVAAQ